MKLVIISDTHGKHERVELPEGNVLIHCGDWSDWSYESATRSFAAWFKKQPFEHKICIAGNHDKFASAKYFEDGDNCHYLQDSSVTIDGVKFYGMPWTPTFYDWYWMKDPGPEMQAKVDLIPEDTNVLITHGPAWGALDKTQEGDHVGCEELNKRLNALKQLNVHCFGHIHEAYEHLDLTDCYDMLYLGPDESEPLHSVNASQVNRQMRLVNKPIVVEI